MWDFDDPVASEGRFRDAADAADSELTRDVLLTQVCRALGLQKRFHEATDLLDSLPASDRELAVRVLLEGGRLLKSGGHDDEARPLFEVAFEAAMSAEYEHLAVDALHMVAIVAPAAEQDELNRRALAMSDTASDPRARRWRASLLNNLGWSAFERGDHAAALALFEDALAERILQAQPAEILIARWCIGRTLRALGRLDEALAIQRALANDHATAGSSDPYVDEELAALESALKAGSPPNPAPGDPPAES